MHTKRTVFWESSRRPLYPKWVWTDAVGQRHFILDHPIGNAGPLQSSAARSLLARSRQVRKSSSYDGMFTDADAGPSLRQNVAVAGARRLSNLSQGLLTEKSSISNATEDDAEAMQSESTARDALPAVSGNPLTERVLQWLDLAGRTTLIRSENATNAVTKVPTRRICTAQVARNRKTTQIRRFSAGVQYLAPLGPRTESMHQLSLTFDATAAQQGNEDATDKPSGTITPSAETAEYAAAAAAAAADTECAPRHSFGEFVPTAYRCARIFAKRHAAAVGATLPPLQQQHDASFNDVSRNQKATNNTARMATTSAIAGKHRTKASKVQKQQHQPNGSLPTAAQIEQQYHSLIQRKLLENNCNESAARRQLHIFMPNLPDKKTATALPTALSARDDSNSGIAGVDAESSSGLSTILSATIL